MTIPQVSPDAKVVATAPEQSDPAAIRRDRIQRWVFQQGVTQEDFSVTGSLMAVGTFAFWVIVFAFAQFKSPRARRIVNGTAAIVVRDGVPLERVLQMHRVSLDDLKMAARQKGIADLREVQLAVLEPEGRFSFLLPSGPPDEDGEDERAVH